MKKTVLYIYHYKTDMVTNVGYISLTQKYMVDN